MKSVNYLLTYMSITVHDYIAAALASGGLVEAEPLTATTWVRRILMHEEVATLQNGPWESPDDKWSDEEWEYRCVFIRRNLSRFLNGKKVTVALDPKTDEDECLLKRLDRIEDEVWAFRCIEPAPGVRIFGSFAETNIFIALHWGLRRDLGGWGDPRWTAAVNKTRARWGICFGGTKPKTGALNDYISRNTILV
jgi:hypothetical protein